jgi:hypothetical protein
MKNQEAEREAGIADLSLYLSGIVVSTDMEFTEL